MDNDIFLSPVQSCLRRRFRSICFSPCVSGAESTSPVQSDCRGCKFTLSSGSGSAEPQGIKLPRSPPPEGQIFASPGQLSQCVGKSIPWQNERSEGAIFKSRARTPRTFRDRSRRHPAEDIRRSHCQGGACHAQQDVRAFDVLHRSPAREARQGRRRKCRGGSGHQGAIGHGRDAGFLRAPFGDVPPPPHPVQSGPLIRNSA